MQKITMQDEYFPQQSTLFRNEYNELWILRWLRGIKLRTINPYLINQLTYFFKVCIVLLTKQLSITYHTNTYQN